MKFLIDESVEKPIINWLRDRKMEGYIVSDNLKAVVIEGKNITSYLKKIDGKPIYALKKIIRRRSFFVC